MLKKQLVYRLLRLDFPLNIDILVNVYDFPTSDFYTHRLYGHQFIPDPYAFVLDFLIQLTWQATFVCFLNIYRYKICKLHKQNYNHVHKKYCKLLKHYGALVFLNYVRD